MPSYISSNNNRLYAGLEPTFGTAASITTGNLIPAVSLKANIKLQKPRRRDKTGTRTYQGEFGGVRKTADFELRSYLRSWDDTSQAPPHGALVQASLGGAPLSWGGQAIASTNGANVTFAGPHGLTPGQAICIGNELRFVTLISGDNSVQVNAPFTTTNETGVSGTPTMTYLPGEELPSATIFDYWTPSTAVQRIISGAAVNELTLSVNGDYHEFTFSGTAADVVDTGSFQSGEAGVAAFPTEPAQSMAGFALVPGNLGEAWIGASPWQAMTVTAATISVDNDLQLRDQEFGFDLARGICPGMRTVNATVSIFALDDPGTTALYQAARQRSPISFMLQLGQQPGQLAGIYMKSVIPEAPTFDDSQRRLQWRFQNCRAQGGTNDELFIAFA